MLDYFIIYIYILYFYIIYHILAYSVHIHITYIITYNNLYMYISSAHSATVQASCWKAASPSLFCLLPLKSTDSNGRSWRPAWKNGCSTSGRYGERLNVHLLTWNVHKCPVFLKYSILQSKVFFHSLLSKFHPLDIMLYPTVDCGISMTLTFMMCYQFYDIWLCGQNLCQASLCLLQSFVHWITNQLPWQSSNIEQIHRDLHKHLFQQCGHPTLRKTAQKL